MELSMHVTNVITNAYLRKISKSTYRQNIKTNLEMVPFINLELLLIATAK